MKRILSNELIDHVGKNVQIAGWLHKKRLLGGLTFINIRDRKGLAQVLIQSKSEVEKLRGLQLGTVLEIKGRVLEEERAPGGAELHEPEINVLVPVEYESPIEIDKPISHEPDRLDTLLDNRVVTLRNQKEKTIFDVQATICKEIRNYLNNQGFTEVHTPKLLAEPTEGGAEVFTMDYFGKVATLAQSPQFYKQSLVGIFERVFEIAPVYRAEPSATTRHMTEYTSVDGEMGFINLDDLKTTLSGLLGSVVNAVWREHVDQLKVWGVDKPEVPAIIPTLTMQEIHEIYSKETGNSTIGEKDLRPDEEKFICEYAKKKMKSDAIFVGDWPASAMKFYHRKNSDNPEIADRVDLLFKGVEITTGSMRENRYDVLISQLKELAGGDPNDPGFAPILDSIKYGMPTEGGFGLGLERLTQKLLGLNNVKEATLFPRDINRLTP